MLFEKCYPTHSSTAMTEEEQTKYATPMTTKQFVRPFIATAARAEDRENTEPYCYIKTGDVGKLLDALRNVTLHPGHAWELAIKYHKSPALYLFVIEKLHMETRIDLNTFDTDGHPIVDALKERNIHDELPKIMEKTYAHMASRSQRELKAHDENISNAMTELKSPFRLAVAGHAAKGNDAWSDLFDQISNKRTELREKYKKPTLMEQCCWGKRVP